MTATKTTADWQLQADSAKTHGELRQIVARAKLAFARNEVDARTLTALTKKLNDEMGRRQAAARAAR